MAAAAAQALDMQLLPLPPQHRSIQHYSNLQQILLVGEGDFSFSNALAIAFGSARNLVATSLDSEDTVLRRYAGAAAVSLSNLRRLGALLFHGVDATCMAAHGVLGNLSFDCIVYNFPHAGFCGAEEDKRVISRHKRLVRMFFENAAKLLRGNGEVHVSHKVKPPYCEWKLEKEAAKSGLVLKDCCDFAKEAYPGYVNRRGDGTNSADTFHLGVCKTFKFILHPSHNQSFHPLRQLSRLFERGSNFMHSLLSMRLPGAHDQARGTSSPSNFVALGLPAVGSPQEGPEDEPILQSDWNPFQLAQLQPASVPSQGPISERIHCAPSRAAWSMKRPRENGEEMIMEGQRSVKRTRALEWPGLIHQQKVNVHQREGVMLFRSLHPSNNFSVVSSTTMGAMQFNLRSSRPYCPTLHSSFAFR